MVNSSPAMGWDEPVPARQGLGQGDTPAVFPRQV
jgi:hypothetical protein